MSRVTPSFVCVEANLLSFRTAFCISKNGYVYYSGNLFEYVAAEKEIDKSPMNTIVLNESEEFKIFPSLKNIKEVDVSLHVLCLDYNGNVFYYWL